MLDLLIYPLLAMAALVLLYMWGVWFAALVIAVIKTIRGDKL